MAYKTQRNCVYDVLRENEDVSTLDVDIVIEEKEDIEQLLREKPDIEGILGEQNARSIIEDAMKSPSVHTNNTPCHSVGEQTCFSCAKKCILKSGHDIVKGMHLVYGRYFPLAKVNDKINKVLHSASEIFGVEQPFLYEHHAIVSEVLETSSETATVRLVEFTSVGSYTFKVIESDTPIVIDVESDTHISYKKYTEARYSPDIIVSRARSRIGDDSYRLFTHNCEHIAVWCVSGEEQSFQANNTSDKMLIPIFSWIDSVIGIIKPSRFLRIAAIPVGFIFAMISSILFILIDLICCILKLIRITKEMSSGLICKACYNKRKTYLVVKIICAVVGSVALFMTPATGSIAMIFLGILFVLVTAFILPSIVFFFYRKIKKSLNPLYDIPKKVVRKNDDINPGDVLTIPTDHDIIVKNVKVLPRNNNSWLHLEIVHFAWNGLLRTVEKELISFELDKNMLNVFEFSSSAVYSDEEVVDRALKKVGDTNFSTFFYRSSHMSKFCKVINLKVLMKKNAAYFVIMFKFAERKENLNCNLRL